jgi:hypothetical protein
MVARGHARGKQLIDMIRRGSTASRAPPWRLHQWLAIFIKVNFYLRLMRAAANGLTIGNDGVGHGFASLSLVSRNIPLRARCAALQYLQLPGAIQQPALGPSPWSTTCPSDWR